MRLAQMPMQPAAVTVPAAQRLNGVWYQRDDAAHEALAQGWPAALSGETPPAGWTPIAHDPEQGTVAAVSDDGPTGSPRRFSSPQRKPTARRGW